MNPIPLNIPQTLSTPRLTLRAPRQGDATIAYPVVRESLNESKSWMPWATDKYGPEEAEDWYRKAAAALISMAKEVFQPRRIEIQMNAKNRESRAVAERLGFQLDGTLRSNAMVAETLVDTCVYAWVHTERAPAAS